jgi:hypothetical protein
VHHLLQGQRGVPPDVVVSERATVVELCAHDVGEPRR